MALLSTKGTIPKDAVPLTREEALMYQWKQIGRWGNRSDVWIFQWGITTLGAIAGAAGWYINSRYRKKLKLRNYGYITTSLPLIASPAIFSILAHVQFVTSDIFLNETKCFVCVQQRAIALQVATAVLYPMLMSPIINFYMALSYATYRVPYWKDGKETFNVWWKLTKPLGKSLLVSACVQAVTVTYVTYTEAESLYKMRTKLMEIPKETEIEKAENLTVKQ